MITQKEPPAACSGGHIPCWGDSEPERLAIEFYKEWIASCAIKIKHPDQCAIESPDQLLKKDKYKAHTAFAQFPRPAILDPEGELVSDYIDQTIEGDTLCHRWAYNDWSSDFIDVELFFSTAITLNVDIKSALSSQDAWGRTPLHCRLPPEGSELWSYIDRKMLTEIKDHNSSMCLQRSAARGTYDRYDWSCIANNPEIELSCIQTFVKGMYYDIAYPVTSNMDEITRKWVSDADTIRRLLNDGRLAFDCTLAAALLEMHALLKVKSELWRNEKDEPFIRTASDFCNRFWRQLLTSLHASEETNYLPALRRGISEDQLLYALGYGPNDKTPAQICERMHERLNILEDLFEINQRLKDKTSQIPPPQSPSPSNRD